MRRRLAGLRIVVTRAVSQAEELAAPLRELGAIVLLLPVIEIASPSDVAPLREAAAQCDLYDWIIFSSVNAVAAFVAELPLPRSGCRAQIATVGAATRDFAIQNGLAVNVTPSRYVAEALVEALDSEQLRGKRILIPSAAMTREIVPAALASRGAKVDVVEAYRNIIPAGASEQAALTLREPFPDWVTFASSSAVDHLIELVGKAPLERTRIASIGPVTTRTVQKHGLAVAAEAKSHDMPGLVEAIATKRDF